MNNLNYQIKVPGKLMIAGEYAVLSAGYPAIVMAVNRFIHINISPWNSFKLTDGSSDSENIMWTLNETGDVIGLEGKEYAFIKEAIRVTNHFLLEKRILIRPFHMEIQNGLTDTLTGIKYGLGSSAAIVVGVIGAIFCFHNQDIDANKTAIFKLACIAHLKCQGNGSGADIAASTFGGCLCYYRYDYNWLKNKLRNPNTKISGLVETSWPNLNMENINFPSCIKVCVGWTRQTVKTSPLVNQMEAFQRKRPDLYKVFLEESKAAVMEFKKACDLNYGAGVLSAIQQNKKALHYLSQISGIRLETKEIKNLCNIADKYGKSKFSGAGGGDCGIAFLMNDDRINELKSEWKQAGIIPLDLDSYEHGIKMVP